MFRRKRTTHRARKPAYLRDRGEFRDENRCVGTADVSRRVAVATRKKSKKLRDGELNPGLHGDSVGY